MGSNDYATTCPISLEVGRSAIIRFNLDNHTPIVDRMGALNSLKWRVAEAAQDLVAVSSTDIRNCAVDFNRPDLIVTLRQACRR